MTKLADWFVEAGAHYGLPVDVTFALHLSDGRQVNNVLRISGVGGDKGMLIFSDYEAIRADAVQLLSMGFDYSVMNEPSFGETFDLASFEDVFADLGWQASR
jgi:hypothetical protein